MHLRGVADLSHHTPNNSRVHLDQAEVTQDVYTISEKNSDCLVCHSHGANVGVSIGSGGEGPKKAAIVVRLPTSELFLTYHYLRF